MTNFIDEFDSLGVFLWSSDNPTAVRTTLTGFAFTDDALIVGDAGLQQYMHRHKTVDRARFTDGHFSLTIRTDTEIVVQTDPLGQGIVFYYADPSFWAVSNSFLALCRKLKAAKGALNLYRPASLIFFAGPQGLFCGQLCSNNTVVEGIKVLPLRRHIHISAEGLAVKADPAPPPADIDPEAYRAAVAAFLGRAHNRMAALAALYPGRSFLDLSGGQDTRALFGILAGSPILRRRVAARSSRSAAEDFAIATALSRLHGVPIKRPPPLEGRLSGQEAFDIWALGNAGLYALVSKPRTPGPASVLRFAGGNFLARGYVKRSIPQRFLTWRRFITRKDAKILETEFLSALPKSNAKDPLDDTNRLLFHYKNFRARYHYGMTWYKNLTFGTQYSPMMSPDFERVVEIGDALGLTKNNIMRDVIVASDERLAQFRFDSANVSFTQADIETSLCRGMARPWRAPELTTYASPIAVPVAEAEGPSFESVFADRFHAIYKGVVEAGLCGSDFGDEAKAELARNPASRKASVVVGFGLVFGL